MRILITGVRGFVGGHLVFHLNGADNVLFGLVKPSEAKTTEAADEPYEPRAADLNDPLALAALVRDLQPDCVFHVAGVLAGADSRTQYEINVLGTVNLLDAMREANIRPRVVIVGSSAVYGAAAQLPIGEDQPPRPLTHYGCSKLAQEFVGVQYYLAHDLPVVRARTFNLLGPGLSRSMAFSDMSYQVASAETGGPHVLGVGNLHPRRDYVDVRDAVRAYAQLAVSGKPGEVYNVCSGHSRSVRDGLEELIRHATVPVTYEVEEGRKRQAEIAEQIGDPGRLRLATGWRPEVPFEASLADMLTYWRRRSRGRANQS